MLKALLFRLAGFVIAIVAVAPTVLSLLKGSPLPVIPLFRPFFAPAWWWNWVWEWMPAVRYPLRSWHDFLVSLPGIVAALLVGVGFAIAFGARKKSTVRRWEDKL
jgi:hypothetical protein